MTAFNKPTVEDDVFLTLANKRSSSTGTMVGFWGVFFLGVLTLNIAAVFAAATSEFSLNTLQTLSLGENIQLLFGAAAMPLIIGGALVVVGAIGFAGTILLRIVKMKG